MFNIYRMLFFSFEEGQNGQNHSSSDTHHPIKNSPQQNFYSPPLGRDILPKPLNVIWKTLLGTSSLCIFSSILNFKSSNQGIELQAKGSFQRVATLQSHLKDPGSNLSWYLALLGCAQVNTYWIVLTQLRNKAPGDLQFKNVKTQ